MTSGKLLAGSGAGRGGSTGWLGTVVKGWVWCWLAVGRQLVRESQRQSGQWKYGAEMIAAAEVVGTGVRAVAEVVAPVARVVCAAG